MAQQIPSINIRQRMIQVMVLIIVILAGILFSLPADAKTPPRNRSAKSKMHVSKSNSNKACYLLYKKRTTTPKRAIFASNRRVTPKYKAMAETDGPVKSVSAE